MDIFIGIAFIAGGLFMLLFGFIFLSDSIKSQTWPKTTGIVKSSKVVHSLSGNTNRYTPTVLYDYRVQDKKYSGENISIGPVGTLPWVAKNKVDHYPEGSSVQVFYNPQDHSEAVLEPGTTGGTYVLLAVSLFLTCAGIIQLISPFLHIN